MDQYLKQDVGISRNMLRLRKARQLTQSEVVARMQSRGSLMSRSTYANIESGKRNIKVSDLILLKRVFNVDYDEFFKDLVPEE